MRNNNLVTGEEVKNLLKMCIDNDIDVVFCDPENKKQMEWRCQLIRHKWAHIYQDMSLSDIHKELIAVLRHNGIEPNYVMFESLKRYYHKFSK